MVQKGDEWFDIDAFCQSDDNETPTMKIIVLLSDEVDNTSNVSFHLSQTQLQVPV